MKPPGWRPAELGGFDGPKARDRATHLKFDTLAPRAVNAYVAVQFALLVGMTSYFLFLQHTLSSIVQWCLAGLIIWWVMNMGIALEGKRWGLWSEIGRTGALLALLPVLGLGPSLLVPTMTIGVLTVGWLLWLLSSTNRPTPPPVA